MTIGIEDTERVLMKYESRWEKTVFEVSDQV